MYLSTPRVADDVLAGDTVVISHSCLSRHTSSGTVACVLACLNFVRVAFARVDAGLVGKQLLDDLISRETTEEILSISAQWQLELEANQAQTLELKEIQEAPLFRNPLDLKKSFVGIPSSTTLESLFSCPQARPNPHVAVVITRPLETIACFKLAITGIGSFEETTIFVIFDPHARLTRPDGVGFVIRASINDAVASHFASADVVELQRQTPLATSFSGHVFVPNVKHTPEQMHESLIKSSLVALAMQQRIAQLERDAEVLQAALTVLQQKIFRCPLCLEDLPEEEVALVADCSHKVCRGCMKGYVVSKLGDKVYPIFCPTCMVETVPEPGQITDELVQLLGITDAQYRVFQEMEIAPHSVLIHCRNCNSGISVDRTDHNATTIIQCPLLDCKFKWCKECQQEVHLIGPVHSCDGTNEMNHLLAQRGWRRCPGGSGLTRCQTPFQKNEGCNHMKCIAPGCNTHFCYLCGEMIVRSSVRAEVSGAVAAHYARCRLFEYM
ncbi:RING-type domain-containing protein [Mycena chlorophos]|uniref:RING-type domain-containing protein n=1 Tax=Mycena chlorophos TaxID=658473 RepID=A0A8H6SYG5_MYCCL|nr:RING-type domain-containing protein [Mycena chlorophos]